MKTALTLALISILLSACTGEATTVAPTPIVEPEMATATATQAPTLTLTPDAMATHLANRKATQTAIQSQKFATETAKVELAAPLLTPIQEAASEIQGLDIRAATLIHGPKDGILRHIEGEWVITYEPRVFVKNFIVSIRFVNPYDTAQTGRWDYGIMFRSHWGNDQYRLSILSNQSWTLVDSNTWTDLFARNDKHLTAKPGEENTIWLIVVETKAYLFLNGFYIQELDVRENVKPGDILPSTGLYLGNMITTKETEFYDFTVWELP